MEKFFFEVAEIIRYYGYVKVFNHHDSNQPYSVCIVQSSNCTMCLEENSFQVAIKISSREIIIDDYISLTICLTKGIEKVFSVMGGKYNSRGDYYESSLALAMADEILAKIIKFIDSISKEEILKNKFIEDFKETLYYALHTDYISKGMNSYVPKKVFDINENILKWINKHPVALPWIPCSNLSQCFHMELNDVLDLLFNSETFKSYNRNVRDTFGYELILVNENSKIRLSCRKLNVMDNIKKLFK